MANNRLYLYCPVCNRYKMISKHFGLPYGFSDVDLHRMLVFMENHFWCRQYSDSEGVCLCEETAQMTGRELPDDADEDDLGYKV